MSDEARTVIAAFRRATQTSPAQHAATWAQLQERIAADEPAPRESATSTVAARRGFAIGVAIAAAVALAVWAWSWRDAAIEREDGARSQAVDDAARVPAIGNATVASDEVRPLETATTGTSVPSEVVAPEPAPLHSPDAVAPIAPPPAAAVRDPESVRTSDDALAREVELMRSAREAALAGTLDRAVALTATHAHEFPRGKLAHERWALRIDLFCRLGRSDAARATALGFVSAYPDSTLAAERRTTPCPNKP